MALFHWWLPKNAAGWALEAQECCSPGSETSIISQRPLRGTSGPGEKQSATTEATERNMGLSVVVLIQLVITLLPYRFHEAANQFFCLHQQTRRVLVEVQLARNLEL